MTPAVHDANSHARSRYILAISNVFALVPIAYAQTKIKVGLLVFSACASVFMHMTETKHGIVPPARFARWSTLALNIDRIAALATAFAFGWAWLESRCVAPIVLLTVGLVASALGELSSHVPTYVALHLAWHAAAYGSVFIVVQTIS